MFSHIFLSKKSFFSCSSVFPKQCNKIIPKTGVNRILKKTQAPFSLPSRTANLEAHPIDIFKKDIIEYQNKWEILGTFVENGELSTEKK